jgi:hypothetical protein
MRTPDHWLVATMAVAVIAASGSCDPVHNDAVAALGPEAPGVPPGPTHRPGQDCGVCHGGSGPGGKTFVAAGTIYKAYDDPGVLQNATVILTDANGFSPSAPLTTNEAGNFYVTTDDWAPKFPVTVQVTYNGAPAASKMTSHMGKGGGCALCHQGAATATTSPETQSTVAQVYFSSSIAGFMP